VYSDAQGSTEIALSSIQTPALGHNLSLVSAVSASETTQGNNAYYICTRCNSAFKSDGTTSTTVSAETLSALGAAASGTVTNTAATNAAGTATSSSATQGSASVISFDNAATSDPQDQSQSAEVITTSDAQNETGATSTTQDNLAASTDLDEVSTISTTQAANSSGVDAKSVALLTVSVLLVLLIAFAAWRMCKSSALPFVGNLYKPTGAAKLAGEQRVSHA
jgi:hypothetical protein